MFEPKIFGNLRQVQVEEEGYVWLLGYTAGSFRAGHWTVDANLSENTQWKKINKCNHCDFVSPLASNLRRHFKTCQEGKVKVAWIISSGYTASSFTNYFFAK